MDCELILNVILKKEARINKLEKETTHYWETIQSLAQDNEKFEIELKNMEWKLTGIIEELTGEKDKLAEELKQAEKEKTEMANQLKVKEVALKTVTEQVYALSKVIREQNEVAKADAEMQTQEDRNSLGELKNELSEIIAHMKKNMAQIQLDFKTMESQKDATIATLVQEKANLVKKLERAENDMKDLKYDLAKSQMNLVKLTTRNNTVKKELANSLAKVNDLQKRNDEKQLIIDDLIQEKKKMEEVFDEINKKNIELQEELAHHQIALKVVAQDQERVLGELAEVQQNSAELERGYTKELLQLTEENSRLMRELEATETAKNNSEGHIHLALDHKLTEVEKTKREICIQNLKKQLINQYAPLGENEKTLEEQARKMAEKTIQRRELGRELNEWQGEKMLLKKAKQTGLITPSYYRSQVPWDLVYY